MTEVIIYIKISKEKRMNIKRDNYALRPELKHFQSSFSEHGDET